MMENKTHKFAPAKINLHLRVLKELETGYHEIETLYLTISLFDELRIQTRTDNQCNLTIEHSDIPNDDRNLCVQAARLFSTFCGEFSGCDIQLTKRIPVGAGLGGGSSDAAATLHGLNELYNYPISMEEMLKAASQLGADVPFFLKKGLAIGTGKGDVLKYMPLEWDFWILILCPTFRISTRWAYSNLKIGLTKEEKNIILKDRFLKSIQLNNFSEFFENSFEPLVFNHYPFLRKLKQQLYESGASFASLSGTGSAVFGIFTNKELAIKTKLAFSTEMNAFIAQPVEI